MIGEKIKALKKINIRTENFNIFLSYIFNSGVSSKSKNTQLQSNSILLVALSRKYRLSLSVTVEFRLVSFDLAKLNLETRT